jgi:hypothetical protein
MWLEKFVFCGKSIGPTSNYQIVSELLVTGNHILLGIHLLGAIYNLLHHVSVNLSAGKPVRSLGGPWWFVNMWLNLHFRTILEKDVFSMSVGHTPRVLMQGRKKSRRRTPSRISLYSY